MLATFVLIEPILLLIALTTLAGAVAFAWKSIPIHADSTEQPAPDGDHGRDAAGKARRVFALVIGVAAGAAAVGVVLVLMRSQAAVALLGLMAASAAVALTFLTYRPILHRIGRWRGVICIAARVAAWLIVLILICRPQWKWIVVEWEKPLLAVLLDNSLSMSIVDQESTDGLSRATRTNEAMRAAQHTIDRLGRLYEIRFLDIGDAGHPPARWSINSRSPVSAIAAGLRRAGQARSTRGESPVAALIVSDGAENVVSPRVVREVASELASQHTAVLAVGVGPATSTAPAIILEPLVVPGRIGTRDRLRVPAVAQVNGCAGQSIRVEVLWGDETADGRDVPVRESAEQLECEFELQPPGVGLHRLTVRATLPAELGGNSFETSAIVDVRDDRIHVLSLEQHPRSEAAFAVRVLSSDPRFDVSRVLLLGLDRQNKPTAAVPRWTDYDVVILGNVPAKLLGATALRRLADAVRERGVGLLLVGGREQFRDQGYARSALAAVNPVDYSPRRSADDYRPRLRPTEAGRRHAVLAGVDDEPAATSPESRAVWERLPPLSGAAQLGEPKTLATVIATDKAGRPLLVALDVGRGRTIAAAWDGTWPWALASDEGRAIHGRLWRQMVTWLANRRPTAWIVTDRANYVRDALQSGRQILRIRAGLSGLDSPAEQQRPVLLSAELRLRQEQPPPVDSVATPHPDSAPAKADWMIPLRRYGREWRAELPRDLNTESWLGGGDYELEFAIRRGNVDGSGNPSEEQDARSSPERLIARTGFAIVTTNLELTEPTANLTLLREAAAATREVGGKYYPLDEFSDMVRGLMENDRRRRLEHPVNYDLVSRRPWLLLMLAAAALAIEWVARKRGGLA